MNFEMWGKCHNGHGSPVVEFNGAHMKISL